MHAICIALQLVLLNWPSVPHVWSVLGFEHCVTPGLHTPRHAAGEPPHAWFVQPTGVPHSPVARQVFSVRTSSQRVEVGGQLPPQAKPPGADPSGLQTLGHVMPASQVAFARQMRSVLPGPQLREFGVHSTHAPSRHEGLAPVQAAALDQAWLTQVRGVLPVQSCDASGLSHSTQPPLKHAGVVDEHVVWFCH